MPVAEELGYRSPVRKLVRFFRSSRDKWREKCKEAKRENKSLKVRLAKMTESRNRWREEAKRLAGQVQGGAASGRGGPKNEAW